MLARKPILINASGRRKRKLIIIISLALLLIIGIVAILEITDTTHLFHAKKFVAAPTASQNTKGEPADTAQTTGSSDKPTTSDKNTNNPDNPKDQTDGSTLATLLPPSGNFVSAHKVPSNAPISSVCNTSVGASCKITFSSNGVTKSLNPEITDKGGSVYWNSWTPASLGITAGTWTIQAIATLNGQTQTANDALPLEVSQ